MTRMLFTLVAGAFVAGLLVGCNSTPPERRQVRNPNEKIDYFGPDNRLVRKPSQEGLAPSRVNKPAEKTTDPEQLQEWTPPVKKRKPGESITEGMVKIEGGKFKMGYVDPSVTDAGPVQEVDVPAFYIDKYEVTNAQYNEFLKATDYNWKGRYSAWKGGVMPEELANHPVRYISWDDARNFATWSGKRLPTEAEWEKAARGVQWRKYPWGNKFDPKLCNVNKSGIGKTTAVGTFAKGVSQYGVHDMCGNVAEWVGDWYKPYPNSGQNNPDFGETYRVLRGGSYFHASGYETYARMKDKPDTWTNPYYGFRCALDASKAGN